MGIIDRLFGRSGEPPPSGRDVAALVAPLARPAVHLVKSSATTSSYLGGTAALPAAIAWPSNAGKPLTLLASLDLASVSQTLPMPWLPSSGRLLFFYDIDNQPWGFDPDDRGSWAVILVADEVTSPDGATDHRGLPRHYLSFQAISTYPSRQRPEVAALKLSDTETDSLSELSSSAYGDLPCHQVGGFANPIQGDDMEEECQLASHGVNCGDPSVHRSPEFAPLREGARDWRLLLQFDSDDELGVMWGDAGILYFWIREQDARAGRFDTTWLVLQCF
jgi:uncharacterized protein YwqG